MRHSISWIHVVCIGSICAGLSSCSTVTEVVGAIAEACGRPSIEVTTTADLRRSCSEGECSLWGAINLANTCNNGMVVQLQDGARYQVDSDPTTSPPPPAGVVYPVITGQLSIAGNGATITRAEREPFERFFHVQLRGDLALSDLTLEGGGNRERDSDRVRRPWEGGAIVNHGTLSLDNVNTIANKSRTYGGAILNTGNLLVQGGEHRDNETGGGCEGAGGGFLLNKPGASAGIHDALVRGNRGSCGGGIVNEGTLAIFNSTFSHNVAGEDNTYAHGGALWNGSEDDNVALTMIVRSTFSANRAMVGGAIVNDRGARLMINTSTISGNQTYTPCTECEEYDEPRHQGGGIVNGGNLSMKDVTITGNDCNGSLPECSGGLVARSDGSVATLVNVIIAENNGGDCLHDTSGSPPARLVATGANLDSDSTCPGFTIHASPGLGPLLDNGGPSFTHAIISGSPPHDAGTTCFTSDQRRLPRARSDTDPCDIGAFELQPD